MLNKWKVGVGVWALLLAATAVVIYSNTLGASFQFDDFPGIVFNDAIRHLGRPSGIFDAFNTRFLTGVTFALNYLSGRLDPFGFHLVNVLIHAGCGVLTFYLSMATFETPQMRRHALYPCAQQVSVLAAFIFVCHPIQTQGVAYIWQRAESMATLFYLLSMLLYCQARLTNRWVWVVLAFFSSLAAMLSKETAFTLPFGILLYELIFFGEQKDDWRKKSLFWVPIALTLFVIPALMTRAPQITSTIMRPEMYASTDYKPQLTDIGRFVGEEDMPRKDYQLTQINVLRTYLRLLVLPVQQNLDYDYPIAQKLGEHGMGLSILVLGALLFCAAACYRRWKIISFCILCFFLKLSLTSLVVQRDVIFEHRLYLPMFEFSLAAATVLRLVIRRFAIFLACSVAIVSLFAVMTYQRNEVWKSQITLWSDVVAKSPLKARGFNNLGFAYALDNRQDEAYRCFYRARQLSPDALPENLNQMTRLWDIYERQKRV